MRLKQILHIYDSTLHRQENQDHGLYTERHPGHKNKTPKNGKSKPISIA